MPIISTFDLQSQQPDMVVRNIKDMNPVVIFTIGSAALKFAKNELSGYPVIFSMVLSNSGSSAHDVTGVLMDIPEEEKIGMIEKVLGGGKRVGIIYSAGTGVLWAEAVRICGEHGLKAVSARVDSITDFDSSLQKMLGGIDCFLMLPDANIYFDKSVEHLILACIQNKVPVIGLSSSYTRAGALFSLDCSFNDIGRQCGKMAVKAVHSVSVKDIPIESPDKVRLSLNLIAAEKMGIEIPAELVRSAYELVK
jgi:putative ABC transport system substrate-binding protein